LGSTTTPTIGLGGQGTAEVDRRHFLLVWLGNRLSGFENVRWNVESRGCLWCIAPFIDFWAYVVFSSSCPWALCIFVVFVEQFFTFAAEKTLSFKVIKPI
jgi:hypothetical protein